MGPDSTPNLNGTTLVARGDSRNLKLNTKYYLIEKNASSQVIGRWGSSQRGYNNPNIKVEWGIRISLGEGSSVVFAYAVDDLGSTIAPGIGGVAASRVTLDGVATSLYLGSPLFYLFGARENKWPVVVASSGSDQGGLLKMRGSTYLWLMPIAAKVNAEELGFEAHSRGIGMGVSGRIGENLGLEVYAGCVQNELDYKLIGADRDKQDNLLAGVNVLYGAKPWFLRFAAAGRTGDHDYRGWTGLDFELEEKAKFSSYGFRAEASAGYLWQGKAMALVPQVGVRYTYTATERFWTEVPLNPSFERKFGADSFGVWKLVGGIDFKGELKKGKDLPLGLVGGLWLE